MRSHQPRVETLTWPCVSCGSSQFQRLRRYRTHTQHGKNIFGGTWLYECRNCHLVQALPRPAPPALDHYYAEDYRRSGYAGSDVASVPEFPKDNLFYYNRGQSVAELLRPFLHIPNPRILDVGAGYGHILYALGQRYPSSIRRAIEYSELCVQHLKSIGIQVDSQPVEKVLPRYPGQFHLVVLSHVLEHLLDPSQVLRLIQDSLVPGGLLYIEVPNIPLVLAYADHQWAPRFDEPHITFFTGATLCRLLESLGFERRFCASAGPHYKLISPLRYHLPPLRFTLLNLLPARVFHFLRRQRFTQPLRVKEREEAFYQYGGFRIWIRSLWRKKENPTP